MIHCVFISLLIFSQNSHSAVMTQSQYLNHVELAFSEHRSMQERWSALMQVAQSEKSDRIEILNRAAVDKQWFMRSASLVALQNVQPNLALKTAEKLIQDKALMVRSASVEIMKNHMNQLNRSLLWKELEQKYNFRGSQSLWIRAQIVELLAREPAPAELESFRKLVLDKDAEVQRLAAAVLMKMSDRKLN